MNDVIENQEHVAIVGQGYVGLELSMAAANTNLVVYGVDNSKKRIDEIASGISPVENVTDQVLQSMLSKGNYHPTQDFSEIVKCGVVVICVPTPITTNGEPDLSSLYSAIDFIAIHLQPGTLVINESTSYPGTLRNLIKPGIEKVRMDLIDSIKYAVAPERVNPGSGISVSKVTRIVSGIDEASSNAARDFYAKLCDSVLVVESPEIAEMAKLLENSFRQVNISFINEFNLICRNLGIDTRSVIRAAVTKPYGFMEFTPSSGIGGHCIPVDPLYLQYAAKSISKFSSLIEAAYRVNNNHAKELCNLIFNHLGKKPKRFLLLGVAYKPGLSDTRESPSEKLVNYLVSEGVQVGWIDPLVDQFMNQKEANLDELWECALVVTSQENLPISQCLAKGIMVFDSTGHFSDLSAVVQI
jgi:UDP-N-acetyl-D-glucosamine dehydrogenase